MMQAWLLSPSKLLCCCWFWPHLLCSLQDLSSSRTRYWTCARKWKHPVLITGPSGNSQQVTNFNAYPPKGPQERWDNTCVKVKVSESEVAQSCPTLCDPVGCSLPGSSVHGIPQARILEWVAISFSRGSSRPRNRTQASCIVGRRFNLWTICIQKNSIKFWWRNKRSPKRMEKHTIFMNSNIQHRKDVISPPMYL